MTARPLIYAANWKMNHGPAAARAFAERFLDLTEPAPDRASGSFPQRYPSRP
jgi:Triosephosphate isomerase